MLVHCILHVFIIFQNGIQHSLFFVLQLYTHQFSRGRFLSVCLLFKWMKCVLFTQPVMMVLRDHNSHGRTTFWKRYIKIYSALLNHFWFLCHGTLCCWKKPQPLWKMSLVHVRTRTGKCLFLTGFWPCLHHILSVKFPACVTGLLAMMFPTCLLLVPATSWIKVDSCFPSVTDFLNCECCSISPQLLSSIWLKFCFSDLNFVPLPNFANLFVNEKTQRF